MEWLSDNYGNIIVCMIVGAVVTGALLSVLRDRKNRKCGCSQGCANCPASKNNCCKKSGS